MTIVQITAIINLLLAFNTPQPIVTQVQTILIAGSLSAGGSASGSLDNKATTTDPVQTGASSNVVSPTPSPSDILKAMKVYQLAYENSLQDFYYAGDEPLKSATINGEPAVVPGTVHSSDCIMVDDSKVCGYHVSRFTGTRVDENDVIVLTAQDGSTYTGTAKTLR